jgi:UDP-N-acetylmuramyl pentapeptide synthase
MAHLHEAVRGFAVSGHCITNAALCEALIEVVEAGDVVLCKGSRGSRMEEVIHALTTESDYAVSPMKKLVHDTIG